MTDAPQFIVNIKYGTVEIQDRFVPLPCGGMKGQCRRIERDRAGNVELISEWVDTGAELRVWSPPPRIGLLARAARWFRRLA